MNWSPEIFIRHFNNITHATNMIINNKNRTECSSLTPATVHQLLITYTEYFPPFYTKKSPTGLDGRLGTIIIARRWTCLIFAF